MYASSPKADREGLVSDSQDYFASTLPTFLSLLQLRLQLLSNPSSSSAVTSDSPRLQHLTKLVIGQIKLWRLLIDHKNVEYFDRMGITRGVLEAAWGVVREATTTTSTTNELGGGAGGVRERVSGEFEFEECKCFFHFSPLDANSVVFESFHRFINSSLSDSTLDPFPTSPKINPLILGRSLSTRNPTRLHSFPHSVPRRIVPRVESRRVGTVGFGRRGVCQRGGRERGQVGI